MSQCVGCTCTSPALLCASGRLLLATRVEHTFAAFESALADLGATLRTLAPGVLEVTGISSERALRAARRALSSVEALEVTAAVLGEETGEALLAATMSATSLARLDSRLEHRDLLPMFARERKAFRSVYQPIVSLDVGHALIGYEALLRGTGPDGPMMPLEMFEAAAAAGWLHVLDRIGRTTALHGAAGWLGDAQLYVNFLPTTIYRPEVCLRTTERAAERAGLRLDQLVFEVSESEQVHDLDHLAHVFAYYRDRGCRVALDDLGAGYSSLNLLVRLRPDVVKLDKEIVQHLPDPVSSAVVAAVVDIAHAYGGQVLAECVETVEQADAARELGVDLGQGWLLGRPQEAPTDRATVVVPQQDARGRDRTDHRA
ncbi:hypothetical protein acdb102_18850 [Acidothermaceae bacterium B102]|nr:hypothetical protein acdb102_18850 [Acidothermaceae bacterium B102]